MMSSLSPLPGNLVSGIIAVFLLLAIFSVDHCCAQRFSFRDFNDQDWDRLEAGRVASRIQRIGSFDPVARAAWGITDEQFEAMKPILEEWNEREAALYKRQRSEFGLRHAILRFEGKTDEAKRLKEMIRREQDELGAGYIKEITDDHLFPFQSKRIEQKAKQERLLEESFHTDEFYLLAAIIDEADLSRTERQAATKLINEVRNKFLSDVQDLREQTETKVLDALPDDQRRKFKELYGEFYDYPGELESFRQQREKEGWKTGWAQKLWPDDDDKDEADKGNKEDTRNAEQGRGDKKQQ